MVVVGTSGSGKSTLARRIATTLGIPYVELDGLFWEAQWTQAEPAVFQARVEAALAGPTWVVDGNYGGVRPGIWGKAETILWLDYPFRTVFWRALVRTIRRTTLREPLWAGNRESLRRSFLSRQSILVWVVKTYSRRRRDYLELFAQPENGHLQLVHCRHQREADAFVRSLPGTSSPRPERVARHP